MLLIFEVNASWLFIVFFVFYGLHAPHNCFTAFSKQQVLVLCHLRDCVCVCHKRSRVLPIHSNDNCPASTYAKKRKRKQKTQPPGKCQPTRFTSLYSNILKISFYVFLRLTDIKPAYQILNLHVTLTLFSGQGVCCGQKASLYQKSVAILESHTGWPSPDWTVIVRPMYWLANLSD